MRKTIAIAANELSTQWAYLAAAAAFGILVLVAPYAPGLGQWDPTEVRLAGAVLGGEWLCAIVALLLGGSFVVKDLAEGRFGFYLARPVSETSIWFGKLAGAYLTVLGCELLVAAPTVLLQWGFVSGRLHHETGGHAGLAPGLAGAGWAAVVLFGFPLPFLLLGHVAALIWRGRTAWIVLDLVGLGVCGLLGWHAYARLAPHLEGVQGVLLVFWYTVAAAIAVTVAGWRATSVGRADLRAAHRGLSVAVWPLLALVALGTSGFTTWELATGPRNLMGCSGVRATPAGEWLAFGGLTTRPLAIPAGFLYRPSTGGLVRGPGGYAFDSWYWWPSEVVLSANGHHAAWLEAVDRRRWQVVQADLGVRAPRIRRTVLFSSGYEAAALSERGDRLAVIERPLLAVYELPSGRQLASHRLPDRTWLQGLAFVTDDVVLAYATPTASRDGAGQKRQPDPHWVRAYEIDLAGGTFSDTGIRGVSSISDIQVDRRAGEALARVRSGGGGQEAIIDWGTQQVARFLPESSSWLDSWLLADGRVASVRPAHDGAELVVAGPDGEPSTAVDLGPGYRAMIGGEPRPGLLTVTVQTADVPFTDVGTPVTWVVDLGTGRLHELSHGLRVLSTTQSLPAIADVPTPGSLYTRTFHGPGRSLLVWNPTTDELTTVVPPDRAATGFMGSYWDRR